MKGKIKVISGILLMIVGFFTFIFFKNYSGTIIPYPTIWFFAGFLLAFIGFYLFKKAYP